MAKIRKITATYNQVISVVGMITFLSLVTYGFMKLISPHSKALGSFLLGFAIFFILTTLLALYLKYIADLYREIRNFR